MKRTFRHVIARLRERLGGMTQKELAAHAGTSTWTIQAIELLKLKLSPGLAFKISKATGVDYAWLMQNDLTRPPVNQHNEPYSEKDLIRAQRPTKEGWTSRLGGKLELTQAYYTLRLIWEKVSKNADELSFFLYRLKNFLESELQRLPEPPADVILKESEVYVTNEDDYTLESLQVREYPALFPITPRSFEVMHLDADECLEVCKEQQASLAKRYEPWQKTGNATTQKAVIAKPSVNTKSSSPKKPQRALK